MPTESKTLTNEYTEIFTGPGSFEGTEAFAGYVGTSLPAADAPFHLFRTRESQYLTKETLYARSLGLPTDVVFLKD